MLTVDMQKEARKIYQVYKSLSWRLFEIMRDLSVTEN